MSTFELDPGGLRREYVTTRRGKPEIWPVRQGGKTVWRCKNISATEMAMVMRGLQARKKARAESTPAERRERMRRAIVKRMAAMQARGYTPARDLTRENVKRERFKTPIRLRSY